jgi:hypothetical protein
VPVPLTAATAAGLCLLAVVYIRGAVSVKGALRGVQDILYSS